MAVYVQPKELRKALAEISSIHGPIDGGPPPDISDETFKKFILNLVRTSKKRIAALAKTIPEYKISLIADYVTTNRYNVSCENLYTCLRLRAKARDFDVVYKDWLNHYSNAEVQNFIIRMLESNKEMKLLFYDLNNRVLNWIRYDTESIISNICLNFKIFFTLENIKKALKNMFIYEGTNLYLDIMSSLYLYCNKNIYQSVGEAALKTAFYSYDMRERVIFTANLLKEVPLRILVDWLDLFETIDNKYKGTSKKSKNKQQFLEDIESQYEGAKRLYLAWENLIKVKKYFNGDPERIRFWMGYATKYSFNMIRESIYIDFGDYVATEFKGVAAGPVYIYHRREFNTVVISKMRKMSKQKFQKWQYDNYQHRRNGVIYRLVHSAGWQTTLGGRLRTYGITPDSIY